MVTNHMRSNFPQKKITCQACNGKVAIVSPHELPLFWLQAVAMVIAVLAADSTPLFLSIFAVIVAVGSWFRCRTVSLVRYREAGQEKQSTRARVGPGETVN
jgi:hypothetical protein